MRRVVGCLLGSCGHDPYDVRCADPDYRRQPCCGLRVYVDDVGSRDGGHHVDTCRAVGGFIVDLSEVCWVVDSGHGWLRVPLVSAEGLAVSEFSYVDKPGGWLYLEEDCDAGVWLLAHGVRAASFPVDFVDGDAACRSLPRVSAVRS